MFDYDDDLPEVKTSWTTELREGRIMVRSLMAVSLAVGLTVGAVALAVASTVEKVRCCD